MNPILVGWVYWVCSEIRLSILEASIRPSPHLESFSCQQVSVSRLSNLGALCFATRLNQHAPDYNEDKWCKQRPQQLFDLRCTWMSKWLDSDLIVPNEFRLNQYSIVRYIQHGLFHIPVPFSLPITEFTWYWLDANKTVGSLLSYYSILSPMNFLSKVEFPIFRN